MVKNLPANAGSGFDPWIGKIPWGKWQPAPVFLPGKFHRERNWAGYSPWGYKESEMTEQPSTLKSTSHNCWEHLPQPLKPVGPGAYALQQKKPPQWGPRVPQPESSPYSTTRESPCTAAKTQHSQKEKNVKDNPLPSLTTTTKNQAYNSDEVTNSTLKTGWWLQRWRRSHQPIPPMESWVYTRFCKCFPLKLK